MDIEKIQQQLSNNEITLLDVREKDEWGEGHIEGAINIPLGYLTIDTTREISKDTPLYIYCRSGDRAGRAEELLKSFGFSNALNIGGIIEWQEKGGELSK